MDRISDSGSDDWGSTPHGRTKKTDGSNRRPFFLRERASSPGTLCCARAPGYGKVSSLCDDNLFS